MEKKTKDCVFALGLLALGAYVIYESWNMLGRAARPPYNVKDFSISPAMLPMVLGFGLVLFCIVLLVSALKGGGENRLSAHLSAAGQRFAHAMRQRDTISMIVSTVIMFIYTFYLIGSMPYWLGAAIFLVALMGFLRASRWYIILISSGASIALIIVLFQILFRTTLP